MPHRISPTRIQVNTTSQGNTMHSNNDVIDGDHANPFIRHDHKSCELIASNLRSSRIFRAVRVVDDEQPGSVALTAHHFGAIARQHYLLAVRVDAGRAPFETR
jgi:hypothetical protein